MRVFGLPKAFYHIARHPPPQLSDKARERLRYLSCWQALREQGLSSAQASQVLGLPRASLYRWQQHLRQGPGGLEDKSHRPQRPRQPTWRPELAQAVLARLRRAGAVPPLGQRQAGGAAAPRGVAGIHLHGGPHPHPPQSPGGAAETSP